MRAIVLSYSEVGWLIYECSLNDDGKIVARGDVLSAWERLDHAKVNAVTLGRILGITELRREIAPGVTGHIDALPTSGVSFHAISNHYDF